MGYTEHLQRVVDYIEEHIRSPISIEDCADAAGFSKYHFHRLFVVHVGIPVMEYVRKRRLAHAMLAVTRGKRILDIALDYGYGSERAFGRAFAQEFGKNPTAFRKAVYAIPPKIDLMQLEARSAWRADYFVSSKGGIVLDYLSDIRFETLDTRWVASASIASQTPEEDVIDFMTDWCEKNGIDPRSRSFGFDVDVTEEESARGLRGYEYCVTVPAGTKVSGKVTLKKIERGRYAVLRIHDAFADPFARIPAGWQKLVAWVKDPQNGVRINREGYCLEEKVTVDGVVCLDIFLAVEEAA